MELRLPDLSKSDEGVVITLWHASEKERVERGQDLVEVATDKATFDVPAPCDGVLVRIRKNPGEEVGTGEIIAEISEGDRDG